MAVRFGVFVLQGWRLDLVKIDDPVATYLVSNSVCLSGTRSFSLH